MLAVIPELLMPWLSCRYLFLVGMLMSQYTITGACSNAFLLTQALNCCLRTLDKACAWCFSLPNITMFQGLAIKVLHSTSDVCAQC